MNNREFKSIILNSSSPYLIAPKGIWINADREELYLDEMDMDYKENCYYMLKKAESDIKRGFFLNGVRFDQSDYGMILEKALELYDEKLLELKRELKL